MTDWVKAGYKADAKRVLNLYRRSFGSPSKDIARGRVIAAMKAAGVTVLLDLWGGGTSAELFVAAGFRVISVEDGSMQLKDGKRLISVARKQRAHELAGLEGGYETFWGTIAEALAAFPDIDGAFLDFCGPWASGPREAVSASRRLKCVAVTLTGGHDTSTGATNAFEREMSYQLYLKLYWAERPRWAAIDGSGSVRRLLDYRVPGGQIVFLYLLSHEWVKVPPLTFQERALTKPQTRLARNARIRSNYAILPIDERRRVSGSIKRGRKGPFTRSCIECETVFTTNNCAQTCSQECRAGRHYRQNRERLGRLAAVSGTTAEAI